MVFRRQSQLRPVHSIKHIVDSQQALNVATLQNVELVISTDAPVLANVTQVETGSRVNSLFLNVQVAATSTASIANIYFILYKNPGSNIAAGQIPNANVTGSSDFKKQIFHTEMIMTEKNTTAIPRTMFKGVLMIPKHMRTMRVNDKIELQFFSPGVSYEICVECIYKEYR